MMEIQKLTGGQKNLSKFVLRTWNYWFKIPIKYKRYTISQLNWKICCLPYKNLVYIILSIS